jgi:ubiquinone/menaquinone biosynthesis C-methylase UbiE
MSKKYEYNKETAKAYKGLGVAGTTYEPTFDLAAKVIGKLNGNSVLDFGSGAVRSAKFLLNLGAKKIIGVDHNISMVEEAKKEKINKAEFHLIKTKIPLQDSSIDLAFSSWVFMEIDDIKNIQKAMFEISRVLKPKGRFFLIVATPKSAFGHDYVSFKYVDNPKSLKSGDITKLIIKADKPFVVDDHYWTVKDYKKTLEKADFQIKEIFYPKPKTGKWLDETKVPAHMIIEAIKTR